MKVRNSIRSLKNQPGAQVVRRRGRVERRGLDHHPVLRAEPLEGAIAPMDCFFDDRDGRVLCSHQDDAQLCATKLLWTRVQMGVIKSLQRTTLAELVEFATPNEPTLEIHG